MEGKELKAGHFDLVYQNGFIRYIRLGGLEVIRMINHALRDHNWNTLPMQIIDEKVSAQADSFRISYRALYKRNDINFDLECKISGDSNGRITFDYNGIAKSDFLRNRIGFTVLHPIDPCKGKKVRIMHPDGSSTKSRFPEDISPNQPFYDISEMHWTMSGGIKARLIFEGEIFETEDQRNWTDASYKTYCTPLGIPFPVQVKKGDQIRQKVHLVVDTPLGLNFGTSKKLPIKISLQGQKLNLTQFGIELKPGTDPSLIKQAIADLAPDFWRIDLDLDHDFSAALDLLKEAENTGTSVELCVFSDRENPVSDLEGLKSYFGPVKRLLLFGDNQKTTPKSWLEAVPQLRNSFPRIEIYAGTDAFFTELNRDPVEADHLDGVTYSINPQVHAFDDQSLVETLECQAYTVQSAQNLFPGKKINISPVTFHMRWNPNATKSGKKIRVPTGWADNRQYSFFGACWFLFSLKYLGESGANAVTYFELAAEKGWIKSKNKFQKSPAYVLREHTKAFSKLVPCQSSNPLIVDVIGLHHLGQTLLILVNWTDKDQIVSVPEGYKPIQYCQNWDPDQGKFLWVEVDELQDLEYLILAPNSLTWLTKR
ncbi:hypothetical protein [Aquiflexum sp.]|uniref:hypothetical protein n=1 Tax=Aquiflexum sp. TaxID=1872584 RepID=UPI0035939292